jgi:hypothetical protein
MDISGIIGDALRYPFTDWKKILILGIIIFISSIPSRSLGITNIELILLFVVIGFIAGLFVNGYLFRIVKSSLDDNYKLPEFNKWIYMLIDGFKVFLVFLVYLILPPMVILFLLLFFTGFDITMFQSNLSIFGSLEINPLEFLTSGILPGIENLFLISFDLFGEIALFVFFYVIIFLPVFLVAIAGMAYDEGELRSAFRFREILEDIADIGWGNLIKWYIRTGILFLILLMLGNSLAYLLSFINFAVVSVLLSLILI